MGLKVTGSGGGGELTPEGSYLARCYNVIDLGHQYSDKYEKWSHKLNISFEVPELRIKIEGDNGDSKDMPKAIGRMFTASLHEKSALRPFLEAWRGKAFTEEELAGFEMENLIGAPCQLQIVHTSRGGKTYADINSIMAVPKGTKVPELENAGQFFSLQDGFEIPANVPNWQVEIIKTSREWREMEEADAALSGVEQDDENHPKVQEDDDLPF